MKKRFVFGLLAAWLLLPVMEPMALINEISSDAFIVTYEISLDGNSKGWVEIIVDGDAFTSRYYHINANDRVPFFAQRKSGLLKEKLHAVELEFDGRKYKVFNDLTTELPDNLPSFLRAESARQNQAVLVNRLNGEVEVIFDRIPMVTFESLVIGFLFGTLKSDRHMILFEGANEIIMKIFFVENDIVNENPCFKAKYSFFRENIPEQPPLFLFDTLVNNDGVPLSFQSSRWLFSIDQIGKLEKITKNIRPYLLEKAEGEIRRLFSTSNVEIVDLQIGHFEDGGNVSYRYEYDMIVRFVPNPDYRYEALRYLQRQFAHGTSSAENAQHILRTENGYLIVAQKDEVCRLLRDRNSEYRDCETIATEGSTTVPIEDFLGIVQREKGQDSLLIERVERRWRGTEYLIKNDKDEALNINMKDACRLYLKTVFQDAEMKYKSYKMNTKETEVFTIDEDGMEISLKKLIPKSIVIDYFEKTAIPEAEILVAARSVLYKKLYGHSIPHAFVDSIDMNLDQIGYRNYRLFVSQNQIDEVVAQKRQEELRAASDRAGLVEWSALGPDGAYRVKGNSTFHAGTLSESVLNRLMQNYPRLKYAHGSIQKENENWIFSVISPGISICR